MKEQAMRKSIVTVLAALAVSAAATPAAAEEFERASVTVSFADLDLTKPAGVATLQSRIRTAVKQVCSKVEPRLLRGQIAWEQCKADSLADAMEQLAALTPAPNLALASEN
jgi:UrcA family protein